MVLRDTCPRLRPPTRYGTLTPSGVAFQTTSLPAGPSLGCVATPPQMPYNPDANPLLGRTGLGASRLARHYYGTLF